MISIGCYSTDGGQADGRASGFDPSAVIELHLLRIRSSQVVGLEYRLNGARY
jgi:hypothetical protein